MDGRGTAVGDLTALIDGFEDNDLSEYSGDTSAFTTQTGTVKDGTYALEGTVSNATKVIVSTSGLNAYPSPGKVFNGWVQNGANGIGNGAVFGVQDPANPLNACYAAVVWENSGGLDLRKYTNGSIEATLASVNATISNNTWYLPEVRWDDDSGDFEIELYDNTGSSLGSDTGNDNEYEASNFGLLVTTGSSSTYTGWSDLWQIAGIV